MAGIINYNFDSLATLGGNLQGEFAHLEELAGNLRRQVQALGENWSSPDAKVAFEGAQAHWDRVFGQSREQLLGLRHGVRRASETMNDVDTGLGRGFGGMF